MNCEEYLDVVGSFLGGLILEWTEVQGALRHYKECRECRNTNLPNELEFWVFTRRELQKLGFFVPTQGPGLKRSDL